MAHVRRIVLRKERLQKLLGQYPVVSQICTHLARVGGRPLLIGGAVRDVLLGTLAHDLDIEIYRLPLKKVQKILSAYGSVMLVGKSFGVLRIRGLPIDWSLPRTDSAGRKPTVALDPYMSVKDACLRRDLTINAIGIDVITHKVVDPLNGRLDLQKKILRTPDVRRFVEDPLRFYRVMQFIGRFHMHPDRTLNRVCARMDISGVSRERVEQEFCKLFLKSRRPSRGIVWLQKIGRLAEIMPEVAALVGVQQSEKWHPEGDVYVHTLQVLDAAAAIKGYSARERLILMWAALCHDVGKAVSSQHHADGQVSAHGHEEAGVALAKQLLARFTRDAALIRSVCVLVRYHMAPRTCIEQHAKPAAYKRLALHVQPVSLKFLATFACADLRGRNPKGLAPLRCACVQEQEFVKKAQRFGVLEGVAKPILHGRDLVEIEPGPLMGRVLKRAYQIQLYENITDKNILKRRALAEIIGRCVD